MKLLKNFHARFWVVTFLLAGLIWILQQLLPNAVSESVWSIFLFMVILSYIVSAGSNWLYGQSPENFLQIKLLGMVIRILASLGYIAWVVLAGEKNIILFISNFFILFLFYLIFDIYTFITNLRPISK
ncbi:hypothetical protein [Algoriphagus mannitolivorans]|uniref:hypothetical protein n=1 Tax=Algoriphagus mannitolivorans TaxID=226504 RepID=UPI00041CF646|nr:hypothetical protein [Algoriphagus mannitolivorans]